MAVAVAVAVAVVSLVLVVLLVLVSGDAIGGNLFNDPLPVLLGDGVELAEATTKGCCLPPSSE